MTKKEFVKEVARELETTQSVANECIGAVFNVITNALVQGDEISVPGFGKFSVTERAPREARNPLTGEKIHVDAKNAAKFKPSSVLKEAIN